MKKTYLKLIIISHLLASSMVYSQTIDSSKVVNLSEVEIKNQQKVNDPKRMPDIKDNVIYAGKKSEIIDLSTSNADLSTNNTRQVFGKIPGVSVWENDGSGIQVGIATRGLNPNRSWEFNVRQNGYDVSSEIFGYPEAYYSPPMEALSKIELVRGAASLQFGPQFGGLLNYEIKKGNPNKPVSVETQQTVGSYGLFNSYNAVGGTYKKLSYYSFFHHRTADGWRHNSGYNTYTGYFSANYQLTSKIYLQAEYTHMDYKSQQPGGLTDAQFKDNSRQSLRERNWFGTPWHVMSLLLKYEISSKVSLQLKSFATIGERNSVGFVGIITTKDTINATTRDYNPRQIDRDYYKNIGSEARIAAKYNLFGNENCLAGGLRIYNGNTKRYQQGKGSSDSNFDLSLTNPNYGRALEYNTVNFAAFAENIFNIGKRLKVVPGVRLEWIENTSKGYFNLTTNGGIKPDKRTRTIVLYGLGTEFLVSPTTNVYANYSVSYRPVTFSELTPLATTEIIDQNLKDATGFNADLGYRGSFKNFIQFDVSLFYLHYGNRIGNISQNGNLFRTNIGTSVSLGLESYIEIDVIKMITDKSKYGSVGIFAANSLIDAKYVSWNNPAIANNPKTSIEDKRVENAPQYIHRFGANYYYKGLSASVQLSSVGDVFTDAINTETANAIGTIGKLNGYQVWDVSASYRFFEKYIIKAGLNNLTDATYATRRATGYPGPGILPANGRTFFVSFGANF